MQTMQPTVPRDPPMSWRRDFRFRTGFASLFRRRESAASLYTKVDLHRALKYHADAIYDLRRYIDNVRLTYLDREPLFPDMIQAASEPPVNFMRVYNSRLPWYLDVLPTSNGSFVCLADVFIALHQALSYPIVQSDFYNDELDDADRDLLTQAWDERCETDEERNAGVLRVDFLRGKYMFAGLVKGRNGMWQLKTAYP